MPLIEELVVPFQPPVSWEVDEYQSRKSETGTNPDVDLLVDDAEIVDVGHRGVVPVLDEHVAKFDLGAVDVLASNVELGVAPTLCVAEREYVPDLGGETRRQVRKGVLRRVSVA